MNTQPQESIFKYASSAMSTSPSFSNILQTSHFDCLINFLVIYPANAVATSALFSSRTLSRIFYVLGSKMTSFTTRHSWFSDVRSFSQKLIFSLIKERYRKILSEFRTSRKFTRNLPPRICLYWEKHLIGSFCSLAVITYW